ncbi:vacuolar cation/proton exchanger 3-like isoform X2 [Trifolium pratense]|uniref:vacuolar cation/proton exchanger 3-like isoform X2 n=1 Tax=Trifolium pratense TaxID=57577 RepID=UPI001E697E3A|nr:vacuolar cation/proton exchanger 3-like isoform X2 [Trifolium pratense]
MDMLSVTDIFTGQKLCGLIKQRLAEVTPRDSQRLAVKKDISLGVALGSATQIAMIVVPLCVIVAWIMGVKMDLNFNLLETGSLALAIIVSAFTLQVETEDEVLLYCSNLFLVMYSRGCRLIFPKLINFFLSSFAFLNLLQ